MGTKLNVRLTPITPSVKNMLTITESATKQYKAFLSAMITVPSMILTNTELYKKPARFFDMAALYCLSKNCKVSNIWMLPDEEHMEVDIYYIMGTVQAVLRVDVCSLVPEELRKDKHELITWYMYTITCLTYFSQGRTFFVHIDDDEKIKAAQQRYAEGKCVLPCNEYTYLLCLGDMPKGDFSISDNLLQPAGAGGNFLTVETSNKPVTELPDVDLNGIEDRLYDLFVYQMETQKLVGADTETTGLDIFTADLVSLGICFNTRIGFYVSVKHTPPRQRKLVDSSTGFIPALVSIRRKFDLSGGLQYVGKRGDSTKNISRDMLMAITNKLKTMDSIWHNAKFDFNIMLSNTGIRLPIWLDTMIAHYITRPGNGIKGDMRRSLKIVACKELNVSGWAIDIVKCQAEDKDLVAAYNARDTCYMLGLAFVMAPDIAEHYDLIFNIEMKYLPILCMAERIGIRLDVKQLKAIETDLRAKADAIKAEFEAMFGPEEKFNINSNDMLKDLFYNRWEIVPPRKCKTCGVRHQQRHFKCVNPQCSEFDKEGSAPMEFTTPSGEPSMDKFVLDALMQAGVEKAKDLKEYKLANKLITSYCTLDKMISPYDRMIHPQYNQAQTETGRLCLPPGTLIDIVRDVSKYPKGVPIEDVKAGDLAYTYDKDRVLTLRKVLWAGKTGVKKKFVRLYWQGTGRHTEGYLELTPNHEVRMLDGSYKSAELICVGDRVLSMARTETTGYSRLHAFGNTEYRDHLFIARTLGLTTHEKTCVHHVDGNKLNNSIDNLTPISLAEHSKLHAKETMKDNPERVAQLVKLTKEVRKKCPELFIHRGENSALWLGLTKFQVLRELVRVKGKTKFVNYDYETFIKYCKLHGVDHRAVHYRYSPTTLKYIPSNDIRKMLESEGSTLVEYRKKYGITRLHVKRLSEYFANNHRISKIEVIYKTSVVYDIEVDETHNFIANEICVHNSSSKPNFQQLPKKAGKYMRKCFTGKPGYCIISADYAGQEIRILAAHTRDEKLIRAYNPCYHCEHNQNGKGLYKVQNCPFEDHSEGSQCNTVDIHSYITKQVYHDKINVPIEQIKNVPEFNRMRSICKSVTFGLAYGSTAVGLANSTGIPLDEAKEVMHTYFSTFPTIKDYIEKCQLYVDKYGELVDMVGRKRLFKFAGWSIPSKANTYYSGTAENERGFHYPERMFAKEVRKNLREATNFPIQGLAASMTKIAAINIDRMFREAHLDAWLIEFVHDEVVVTCPRDEATIRQVIDIITEGMEKSIDIPSHCIKNHPLGWSWPDYIPMKVEVEVGDSYGSIMEPEEYYRQLNAEEAALTTPVTHEVELLDDDESEQFGVETI